MKKPYQIDGQRAVKRLEEMAAEGNAAVQMVLPMAEALGWLKQGVGELIRQAGDILRGDMREQMIVVWPFRDGAMALKAAVRDHRTSVDAF